MKVGREFLKRNTMEQIQYIQGNKDLPYEHQMLYILRNYQGMMNCLEKCRIERDRYKKMYYDAEPIIKGVRDANKRINELNNVIMRKQKKLEQLNACLKEKNEKLGSLNRRLKEKNIEVGQKENQLAFLETQIGKLARTDGTTHEEC